MAAEKASGGRGTWEQTSLSSHAESEKPAGEGVQREIEYIKPKLPVGRVWQRTWEMWEKTRGQWGLWSPGRGGGNCRLNVLPRPLTHTHVHTCTHTANI